jgi:hypothetical protein
MPPDRKLSTSSTDAYEAEHDVDLGLYSGAEDYEQPDEAGIEEMVMSAMHYGRAADLGASIVEEAGFYTLGRYFGHCE